MKPALFSILCLLGYCFTAMAQQPEMPDSTAMRPAEQVAPSDQTDSLSDETFSFEEYMARDSVWQEAIAEGGINFRVFGRYARDDARYAQLKTRFEQCDTTLFGSDILTLYYGFAYRDEYNGGYGMKPWVDLMKKGKYAEAYALINSALDIAPATPYILTDAIRAARELERPEEEVYGLQWRLYTVLMWMNITGDGTENRPVSVVNVSDEYVYMFDYLGVEQFKGQALIHQDNGSICDRMEIEPLDTPYFCGSAVWFEITFPFTTLGSSRHWAKILSETTDENN